MEKVNKQRIALTLKVSHIEFLQAEAQRIGVSVSAVNDMVITDYISQVEQRKRMAKIYGNH